MMGNAARLKKIIYLCLLVLGYLPCANAGGISTGTRPAWVTAITADPDARVSSQQIEDGYYYLLCDKQVNVQTSSHYYHYVKKIVSNAGVENCSEIEFTYDKSFDNIVVDKICIIRNSKVINKSDLSKLKTVQKGKELENHQYDETMSGILFLEDVKAGDIIEYAYTKTSKNPLFADKYSSLFDLRFSAPVSSIFYRLLIPENRKLNVKCYNNGQLPQEKVVNGFREYNWNLHDVAALKMDDGVPRGYDPYPYAAVSEYGSWKEVKKWANNIYAPVMVAGDLVRAKAAQIARNYGDGKDRIIAALRFVQDQVRYLGMETGVNTHKPHSPELVLRQGFGDCKDKSILLCCLLKEMGITAHPVLINSRAPDLMPGLLPSPDMFDHVCVAVDYGGTYYFFDATINYQRGALSNTYFPLYKYGLIITDSSENLVKLPHNAENTSTTVLNKLDIKDTASPARLEVLTDYSGSNADDFRRDYAESSLQELQKSYVNFYTSVYKDIEVADSIRIIKDDTIENKITTIEVYTINDIWKYKEEKDRWEVHLSTSISGLLNKPKSRKRTMPIGITFPRNYTEKFDIKLFKKWEVKNEHEVIENPALRFSMAANYDDDLQILHLEYGLKSKSYETELSGNKQYFADIDKIVDNLGYRISYSSETQQPGTSSSGFFSIFIFLFVIAAGAFACYRLYVNYDIVTEYTGIEPIRFGGWLILPVIGVTLSPFLLGYGILNAGFFSENTNEILFNKNAVNYNLPLGIELTIELILNSVAFVMTVFTAVLMYKKRSIFPQIYIATLLVFLVVHFFDLIVVNANFQASAHASTTSGTELIKVIIQCLIWIPYMLRADRVKQTFTLQHPDRRRIDLPPEIFR